MVARWNVLFFLISFWLSVSLLSAQEVTVEASINPNEAISGQPIKGTLLITHKRNSLVDNQSFQLGEKALSATLVQETKISSDPMGLLISIYEFELPPKEKGLYSLDKIKVKVGGKTYESIATGYAVKDLSTSTSISPSGSSFTHQSPPIFHLEAAVQGPSTLYPGQRAKLFYRITYNRSVDLTFSDLPLLHTQEFNKIGDEQVKDYEQNSLTYQEIIQEIEALKPGTFRYGPSIIEGHAYTLNRLGQKVYEKTKLRAEAPPVEVVVTSFPIDNKPASFNGTLGKLEVQIRMTTPDKIALGDKINLDIYLKGATHLAEVKLPNLYCQPGFSGFFRLSNLPPLTNIKGGMKYFQIELRPISRFVQHIPSIEISSFDPQTLNYSTWRSQPIPLTLELPPLIQQQAFFTPPLASDLDLEKFWQNIALELPSLEISGRPIEISELKSSQFRTFSVLWIIPVGILFLTAQFYLYQWWQDYTKKPKMRESQVLFQAAIRGKYAQIQLRGLEEAFLLKLNEKGLAIETIEEVPNQEPFKHIREFLLYLQFLRYGSKEKQKEVNDILQKAQHLFLSL